MTTYVPFHSDPNSGLPSKELLPDYMKHQRWMDLADAMDAVFGNSTGMQEKLLRYIRYHYIPNNETEQLTKDHKMIGFDKWDMADREVAAFQTELSGLRLNDASYVGNYGFVNLFRNVGNFWYRKGLYDFVDFIGFALNVPIEMVVLWTEDYDTFVPEDEFKQAKLIPIDSGGTWYPTTHIRLRFEGNLMPLNYQGMMLRLFYDISNYNLVLNALEELFNFWLGTDGAQLADGSWSAQILQLGVVDYDYITITN